MSTFNGLVAEFPDIRIDFFRKHPEVPPPLACFLSHVHSDHFAGLETLRSPFVYCSAATREILLRLERYPCRINYAKGILEARQQTFKHLQKILKPLPLETPICLELAPNREIQVTLFDANHCPGAVMFLLEGDGKAILYTGDIRSEPWFVTSLARNPTLIQYTSGIRRLDKIYLDTSFIQDIPFQTKAEGIAELLRKVSRYPKETVFQVQAWTYGYEDVWVALSKALDSKIHVDKYKMKIYQSLLVKSSDRFETTYHLCREAPPLTGFTCGNQYHEGCLTSDEGQNVRLHSCEKDNMCDAARHPSVVHIRPIIAHLRGGGDLYEMGVGGGADDLEREAEIDMLSEEDVNALLSSVREAEQVPAETREAIAAFLKACASSGRDLTLDIDISSFDEANTAKVTDIFEAIKKKTAVSHIARDESTKSGALPKAIHFPYSRHSSYAELCELVDIFKPEDVWPCTVDVKHWLEDDVTIRSLFGQYCSGQVFQHDLHMETLKERHTEKVAKDDTQRLTDSFQRINSSPMLPSSPSPTRSEYETALPSVEFNDIPRMLSLLPITQPQDDIPPIPSDHEKSSPTPIHHEKSSTTPRPATPKPTPQKRTFDEFTANIIDLTADSEVGEEEEEEESQQTQRSITSGICVHDSPTRQEAYHSMLGGKWIGWELGLICAGGGHGSIDKDLGSVNTRSSSS